MMLIDGKERKKLIIEAKKYGGITIPRMKLQVHQSGAKFPISKVYVDDEQLNPDAFYTLLIIPEGMSMSGYVKAVLLSIIDDGIPIPEIVAINEPNGITNYNKEEIKNINFGDFNHKTLMNISKKSLNLLKEERPQEKADINFDAIKFFGILPYPEIKMDGVTYFFFIPDPTARGASREATITLLVSENHKSFIHEHMKTLRSVISECSLKMFKMLSQDQLGSIIGELLKTLNSLIEIE
jgi:hypothetical protein